MDGGEGTTRMYTACEYTWSAQPETIVVPDEHGPIEEFGASSPAISCGILALCILIPVAIAAGGIVLIVHRTKKR